MNRTLATVSLGILLSCCACGARGTAQPADPVDPVVSPHPPSGALTAADRACRQKWVDLYQLHGENGNPGGTLDALDKRWERTNAQADAFAREASSVDCGPAYADLRRRWGGLESLQYDLQKVDMPNRLTLLEGDREHYLKLNDLPDSDEQLPGDLAQQFAVLRKEAPLAEEDLRGVLDGAGEVDVTDKAAVAAYERRVADAARTSEHLHRSLHAAEKIEDAELDEE